MTTEERVLLVNAAEEAEAIALDIGALLSNNSSVDTEADIAARLLVAIEQLDLANVTCLLEQIVETAKGE